MASRDDLNSEMDGKRRGRSGEEGYVLLAVLFMVVLVLISLSIAAPKIAADIQRDREIELQHRGLQYVRAIKLYYKIFGKYPPNLEALEKTNNIRYLRKRYKDPVTGKDEWHLIHFGENKTPSMGFFGQPLGGTGGSTLAGTGPGGVGQGLGSNAGGGIFGGSAVGGGGIGGVTPDPNAGGAGGAAGTVAGGADPNNPGGNAGSSNGIFGASTPGSTNSQTFGGGGIIGVESTSPKATILEYKKKKHFNEWEFWYDPNADRIQISGNTGAIGQPASGVGNGGFASPGGINNGNNGGGIPLPNGGSPTIPPQQPQTPPQ